MWNDGMYIIWNHIADISYEDRECRLDILPKLSYEHIKLTPYSIMNIKLAAQLITASKTLTSYGSPDAAGTAKFCLLVNIRNVNKHTLI